MESKIFFAIKQRYNRKIKLRVQRLESLFDIAPEVALILYEEEMVNKY